MRKREPDPCLTEGLPEDITVNTCFVDALRENNLLDFENIMAMEDGEVIKHAIAERKTVRIVLHGRQPLRLYLKRHYPCGPVKAVMRIIKSADRKTAYDEFVNLCSFHSAGLPAPVPVASGIKKTGFLSSRSFLLTEALEGCTTLEHCLENRITPFERKRRLTEKLAGLVKKMHECGFNHRDLYLCHVLINNNDELFLVDLHRVDRRAKVPERWKIKDLAALNYSSIGRHLNNTDRLRFLKTYLGTERPLSRHRALIIKILKKTEKMLQHNLRRKNKKTTTQQQ